MSGDDFERAHHVVGFVLEDMAVVEVVAGVAFELDDDARDHAWRALHDVFPAALEGFRWHGGGEVLHLLEHVEAIGLKDAAVEYLETHQVKVHGVGVLGEVDELPDFCGVEARLLGNGLVPVLAVYEHDHRVADLVVALAEGDGAGENGGGFRRRGDCAEGGGDRCGRVRFG